VFEHQTISTCGILEVKFHSFLMSPLERRWLVSFTLLLLYYWWKITQLTLNRRDGSQIWSGHDCSEGKCPSSCRDWNALSSCLRFYGDNLNYHVMLSEVTCHSVSITDMQNMFQRGGLGSIQGHSMWDAVYQWHWDRFFPEYFASPVSMIPPMFHTQFIPHRRHVCLAVDSVVK
jgi:hypothetical protein